MDYKIDTHLGSGPVTFTVDARRLIVAYEKSGERTVIPFSCMKEINLRHDMAGVYTAVIHHDEGRPVTIPARHFVSFGRFETRATEYRALLEELHRSVAAANPSVRFVAGSSLMFWTGAVICVLTVGLGLMVVGLVVSRGRMPPMQAIWPLPLGLMIAAGFLRQGRATPYPPNDLPAKLLPIP